MYCPEGSKAPTEVAKGYFTVGAVDDEGMFTHFFLARFYFDILHMFPFLLNQVRQWPHRKYAPPVTTVTRE